MLRTRDTPYLNVPNLFVFAQQPPLGQGLLIHEVSRSHKTTHHSRQDSSGRVISSSQRPLPDKTQQSQQTNIHAPGGIRTHDRSRRAAADLRLRPRGYWDRLYTDVACINALDRLLRFVHQKNINTLKVHILTKI